MAEVPLRVLSYNVHGLRDDLDALAQVVRAERPDVVIVQEGPRRGRWRFHCAQLAKALDLSYAAGGQPALGNVLLTNLRVQVSGREYLRFPLTPGRHLRGAFLARCTAGRTGFLVAGSHLATDPAERPAQARALRKALGAGTGPVILGVDLNEDPDGESWGIVSEGLVDGGAQQPAATYPALGATRRLDAVLVDPRITVTRYRVLSGPATGRASDHLPVCVDLDLPA